MVYKDLRDFISFIDDRGELERIDGAHWKHEIGGIAELTVHDGESPALLFDNISGYEEGFRILVNSIATNYRWLAASGLEPTNDKREAILTFKEHNKSDVESVPPVEVSDPPVRQNIRTGSQVDVSEFPAPIWHENDGGQYIGTADAVITKHRDTQEVNIGTYRVQVIDDTKLTVYISPGKDGMVNRSSYLDEDEPCPMVVSVGHPPDLFLAGSGRMPHDINEFEHVGGRRGEPVEIARGDQTSLPIPAYSELAFEGHVYPDDDPVDEGPFGEWTGYYAGGEHDVIPLAVEQVYFRDDPINLGSPPIRPPARARTEIRDAAQLWNELDESGIPGIEEVNAMPWGPGWFKVVSISQEYGGHSAQVGYHAASGPADAYHGRFTLVVDDDIDVFDEDEVLWAMCTRTNPEDDMHLLEDCWSTTLDPAVPMDKKDEGDLTNSRFIIDATRPYHRLQDYPAVVGASDELKEELRRDWPDLIN